VGRWAATNEVRRALDPERCEAKRSKATMTSSEVIRKKVQSRNLFNCNDISGFLKSIEIILPFTGYSKSKFMICEIDNVRFLVKLSFYRKDQPEIYGRHNPETIHQNDAEINIMMVLKERFLNSNVSPCILDLIMYKKCNTLHLASPDDVICERIVSREYSYTQVEESIETAFCRHRDLMNNKLGYGEFCYLILEQADITFSGYLKRYINTPINNAVFKSILFQVIYTIYQIKKLYPSFKHNDLHADNIMLKYDHEHKYRSSKPKFMVYMDGSDVNKTRYVVPYFGFIPKIIDYGFAQIDEEHQISDIVDNKIVMYNRIDNDILYLLHDIYNLIDYSPEMENMLSALDPDRFYKTFDPEYIRKHRKMVQSYEQMLKNKIFDEYLIDDPSEENIYHIYDGVPNMKAISLMPTTIRTDKDKPERYKSKVNGGPKAAATKADATKAATKAATKVVTPKPTTPTKSKAVKPKAVKPKAAKVAKPTKSKATAKR